MWQRIHLAAIGGPDSGWAIELGVAGRARIESRVVTLGRGAHCDVSVADPRLSRTHCVLRAGSRWGRAGMWVADVGSANRAYRLPWRIPLPKVPRGFRNQPSLADLQWRHVGVGSRIKIGTTLVQVRSDRPRSTIPWSKLAALLPIVGSLGFLAMMLIPGAGMWPLAIGAAAGGTAVLWRGKRQPQPLPDPAALARNPTTRDDDDGDIRIDIGNLERRSRFGLTLHPGSMIALVGTSGVNELARWILAQLVHHYGASFVVNNLGAEFSGLLPRHLHLASSGAGALGTRKQPPEPWSNQAPRVRLIVTSAPPLITPDDGIVLLLTRSPAIPPPGCRVLPVGPRHNRMVSSRWLEQVLSALPRSSPLPTVTPLAEQLPDLAEIATRWANHGLNLDAPIGVTVDDEDLAPIGIDLGDDSPHAVVAGTTGSGKSEFLLTWLIGLAVRYPPRHVTMVLVDYKGGATFAPLAKLPHVIDVLTDLNHADTVRALASLQVELQRRERLLNHTGTANLTDHLTRCAPEDRLGRLLIVVDEFRVLADQYPEILDQLVRLAAQGRSLGIHLVLSTQRPGGAMNADMRANLGIRVCLRVVEEADSADMLGTTAAATLPKIPGRLLLRTDTVHMVQSSWAGPSDEELVNRVVSACVKAANRMPHLNQTHRPWARPLPPYIEAPSTPAGGDSLTVAVSDLPAQQRLGTWGISTSSQVAIAGPPRSGRTTAARTIAHAALRSGIGVHVIAAETLASGPGVGTHAHPADTVTVHALLTRIVDNSRRARPTAAGDLSSEDPTRVRAPDLLIIDDLAAVVRTIDEASGPGVAPDLFHDVLRAARQSGRGVVLTGDLPQPRWVEAVDERIIFPSPDHHASALAGIPKELCTPGPPGRAVALKSTDAVTIQIHVTPEHTAPPHLEPEFTLRPVPAAVDLPLTSGEATSAVLIGLGGDSAEAIHLPLRSGEVTLVLGMPGAGRSRFAAVFEARLSQVSSAVQMPRVVDDVDRLPPEAMDDLLASHANGAPLVLTCSPPGLSHGFHPLLQRLRQADQTLFIGLVPRTVAGVNIAPYVGHPTPGRAVLSRRGQFTPVQLDWCCQVAVAA